jgi:hypothetical protein
MAPANSTPTAGLSIPTSPGTTSYTNSDGTAINSGGKVGTVATPTPASVIDHSSSPTRTTVPPRTSANNAASADSRYPITPVTADTLLKP